MSATGHGGRTVCIAGVLIALGNTRMRLLHIGHGDCMLISPQLHFPLIIFQLHHNLHEQYQVANA